MAKFTPEQLTVFMEEFINKSEQLRNQSQGAYQQASQPRGRDLADKASLIGGLGAIGIGALTGNKDIAQGGAAWMGNFTPTRDALYQKNQDRTLENTLGGIDAERKALDSELKARSLMYNVNADADATAYNRGQDLEANKIRMYEMMNNLEKTKQAQNMPEKFNTLEGKIASGMATPEDIALWKWMKTASKAQEKTMTPGQNIGYLENLRNAQVNDIFNRATTTARGLDPKYGITNPINSRESLSGAAHSTANYKTNPWFGQGELQPDSSLYNLNNELAGVDSTYLNQLQSLSVESWARQNIRGWDSLDEVKKNAIIQKRMKELGL